MTDPLVDFTILVSLQLVLFIAQAVVVGEKGSILSYLLKGMALGLPFGIAFDLIVGQYFGLFTYVLEYQFWFLVINGIFSYGFMIANVMLMRKCSFIPMYLWSAGLGLALEVVNHFFPVWEFTFGSALVEFKMVVFCLYIGLAWLMMVALQLVYKTDFRVVPFLKRQ